MPTPITNLALGEEARKAATDSTPKNNPPAITNGENNVTVFHDPENFNVKHPLSNAWTLWFTKPPSGKVRDPVSSPPRGS